MEGKLIVIKNEDIKKCPECEGKVEYQEEWDSLFDRYDVNTPSMDLVVKRLYKEGVPKYVCTECGTKILAQP